MTILEKIRKITILNIVILIEFLNISNIKNTHEAGRPRLMILTFFFKFIIYISLPVLYCASLHFVYLTTRTYIFLKIHVRNFTKI